MHLSQMLQLVQQMLEDFNNQAKQNFQNILLANPTGLGLNPNTQMYEAKNSFPNGLEENGPTQQDKGKKVMSNHDEDSQYCGQYRVWNQPADNNPRWIQIDSDIRVFNVVVLTRGEHEME